MPDPSLASAWVTAGFGLGGVAIGALSTAWSTYYLDKRKRQDDAATAGMEATVARHKLRASAADACMKCAVALRAASRTYDHTDTDSQTAWAAANADLDAAVARLTGQEAQGLVAEWQSRSEELVNGMANAADEDEAWRACITALGEKWNEHIDDWVQDRQPE